MPSDDLLHFFTDQFALKNQWRVRGTGIGMAWHRPRPQRSWLVPNPDTCPPRGCWPVEWRALRQNAECVAGPGGCQPQSGERCTRRRCR
jgi:hypothetical protein